MLTRDLTIQQGDTVRLIVPVLDGDDPDAQFYEPVGGGAVEVEVSISESFGAAESLYEDATSDASDDIKIVPFGDVTLSAGAFEGIDTIPDTQDVIVVEIPASETAALVGSGTSSLVYQVRLESGTDRLTPVKGTLTVEPAAHFST